MHPVIGSTWNDESSDADPGGTVLRFLDALVAVRTDTGSTAGRLGIIEFWAARGHGSPMMVHTGEDEGYLVLDGEITWRSGDDPPRRCGAGTLAWAPRGVAHAYTVSSATACFLVLTVPAGLEGLFRQVGVPARSIDLPAGGSAGQDEIDRVLATVPAYGITVVGPPSTV